MSARKATVLLADDSADNAELVKLAFRQAGYDNPIEAVCRGEHAISYLKGDGEYADRVKFPLPHLMLLDTRMLGVSGWEVVKWLREQPAFRLLPVIVFTGSDLPGDKKRAEDMGAMYEIKPQSFTELVNVV